MKYERLTTDKTQSNKDFLLNFAFVKDGEVYLHGMGDDGEEIRLCDYIALRATSEKGCERTPQDILDGACNECNCELAALNIAAIQAAELRHRLADLEDKIESGKMLELPCKVGDMVYVPYVHKGVSGIMKLPVDEIQIAKYSIVFCTDFETDDIDFGIRFSNGLFLLDTYQDIWFTDKSQAKARLKELQGE